MTAQEDGTILDFIGAKHDGGDGDGATWRTKLQLYHHHLPVAQQTVSEYWGEGITFHGPAHPKLTWGSSTLVVTTKGCCLPWQRVAKPLTGLWRQFLIQTTDCRVYIIRNNRHTSTWLVIVWTLSDVTTISFGLFLQWTYTYVHTTDKFVAQ